jgi:serine/alanine adding enzyme
LTADGTASACARIEVAAQPGSDWDAFVRSRRDAPVYLDSRWSLLAARVFDHEPFFFTAYDSAGNVTGVLPIVRLRTALFNYGGALAADEANATRLMEAAADKADHLGISHIEFRDSQPRAGPWQLRTDKVAMLRPLPATEAELGRELGSKLRSQVRRADREKPQVQTGGAELLRGFYQVFAGGMRSLGTPVYPQKFFASLLESFDASCRIVLVSLRGRPVAAGFLVFGRDHAEVPWAACLPEGKAHSINMRLYWELLSHAISRGCKVFDFGRSTADSGTFRFKQQWGAQPQQLYWHYWLRDGKPLPNLTTHNRKYQLAISTWKRLPLWLTKLAGPIIVRGLP